MGEATFLDSQRGGPANVGSDFLGSKRQSAPHACPSTVKVARFLQANPSCVFAEVEQNDINWCLKRRSTANVLTSIP